MTTAADNDRVASGPASPHRPHRRETIEKALPLRGRWGGGIKGDAVGILEIGHEGHHSVRFVGARLGANDHDFAVRPAARQNGGAAILRRSQAMLRVYARFLARRNLSPFIGRLPTPARLRMASTFGGRPFAQLVGRRPIPMCPPANARMPSATRQRCREGAPRVVSLRWPHRRAHRASAGPDGRRVPRP
jgi:hypothetical protein